MRPYWRTLRDGRDVLHLVIGESSDGYLPVCGDWMADAVAIDPIPCAECMDRLLDLEAEAIGI